MLRKTFDLRKVSAFIIAFVVAIIALPFISINSNLNAKAFAAAHATADQNVYSGPSASLYEYQGWIANGESIYILGKENGWYHIQFTGSGITKTGYIPQSGATTISPSSEETLRGGFAYSLSSQNVYYTNNYNNRNKLGNISANEGVTKLGQSTSYGHTVIFVEYSTKGGKAKRGYIFDPNFDYPIQTAVARVKSNCNLDYGMSRDFCFWDNGTFGQAGSLNSGEIVSIVGKYLNSVYVEYNTSKGRKRGHMLASNLDIYTDGSPNYPDVPFMRRHEHNQEIVIQDYFEINVGGTVTVYGGPGNGYAVIGSVSNEPIRYHVGDKYNNYLLIQYKINNTNTIKTGYVYSTDW